MSDGTFMHIQDADGGVGGMPGIERGTYNWNPVTGSFSNALSVDTNGEWGSSHPQGSLAFQISGDTMTISEGGIETGTISRIADVPNSILGTWYVNDPTAYAPNSGQAGGLVAMTFMSNGTYLMGQDGSSLSDPTGQDGMERGTYTWDSVTGDFRSTCPAVDTNGEWGLSHGKAGGADGCTGTMATLIVDGNTLKFNGGDLLATRVASVPVPAAAWLLGSGLLGLVGVARRKAA
ncbi:MAG: VPLPA-CTERM sorting domain-containing protein [Gammaproteobacteria bacterium]|nr:VPLPA-CTERM sorting domain-containing protein [Gammaproteobacteria bacterium]MBU1977892.1 VPLPA-CTERM sorting domain-containing protein [Gammaproteobacteria bacterium]